MVVEGQARNAADGVRIVRGAATQIMVFLALTEQYARNKFT